MRNCLGECGMLGSLCSSCCAAKRSTYALVAEMEGLVPALGRNETVDRLGTTRPGETRVIRNRLGNFGEPLEDSPADPAFWQWTPIGRRTACHPSANAPRECRLAGRVVNARSLLHLQHSFRHNGVECVASAVESAANSLPCGRPAVSGRSTVLFTQSGRSGLPTDARMARHHVRSSVSRLHATIEPLAFTLDGRCTAMSCHSLAAPNSCA